MNAAEQNQIRARAIAFYLPQFYPTPENDEWWGKGFTEWTNVAKAKPLFYGHYQPHIPADLGFYDLRVPETRAAQAELAREYGIEGFCYWHYWFHGRRMLERPFNEVLQSGEPDFPFCLGWANHTWSRSWLGENKNVLVAQTYSAEDDLNHIRWLIGAFSDKRYITVYNRPVLLIYNPYDLPEPQGTFDTFRSECLRHGLENPYIVGLSHTKPDADTRAIGCDISLVYQLQFGNLNGANYDKFSKKRFVSNLLRRKLSGTLKVYDYDKAVNAMKRTHDYPKHTCVVVGWDNTPRRGNRAIIFDGALPHKFKQNLSLVVEEVKLQPLEERLLFLNAWNEWGEGMHLEPDLKYGRGFLEALRGQIIAP